MQRRVKSVLNVGDGVNSLQQSRRSELSSVSSSIRKTSNAENSNDGTHHIQSSVSVLSLNTSKHLPPRPAPHDVDLKPDFIIKQIEILAKIKHENSKLTKHSLKVDEQRLLLEIQENTSEILDDPTALSLSFNGLSIIVQSSILNISEDELWHFLLLWARNKAKVQSELFALWTAAERTALKKLLQPFLAQHYLRILDISVDLFVNEIEALDLVSEFDQLFKFRFEALFAEYNDELPRYQAMSRVISDHFSEDPYDETEFLVRVRQRMEVFESDHPHLQDYEEDCRVECPAWATHVIITFDSRSALAPGADVIFYNTSTFTRSNAIGSLASFEYHVSRKVLVLQVEGEFWFEFTSSEETKFGRQWGYRFTCVPIRSSVVA
uniref:BACK domain-containing protein n=2 Tax=Timspurckia oligopyrenoides TaxID=708627 RepID=A0A7S0ZLG5_9RHOD|mmetsp:Transcript_9909/g.17854  ORF Transcript_9909/g.17854 Transcript_9909/m.17854 type:complete len:380 (+) Transcript_9909:37-1176(+)